jgi:SH3 domain protein
VALLLAVTTNAAPDSQRWVTDQLAVDMRRGQSNRHAITRMVPSGTAVELVQTDKASGYSRIRTPSGVEGWVLSRYLLAQPPARLRLPELETRVSLLRDQQANLSGELQAVRRERDELRQRVSGLETSGRGMEVQLTEARMLSADTAKIAEQNRILGRKLATAERQVSDLGERNRALADQVRRDWFVAGAGVLGAGLALGLILPRIRWQKKNSWGRL